MLLGDSTKRINLQNCIILASIIISIQDKLCEYVLDGECSATCGNGRQKYHVKCPYIRDYDIENKAPHDIPKEEVKRGGGSDDQCKGGWADWEIVGECSVTCGTGRKLKIRKCNYHCSSENYCDGPSYEFMECKNTGCIGSWSCWLNVGACSTSCGNGTQLKERQCNIPTDGGQDCTGDNTTRDYCNIRDCPVNKWGYLKEQNLTKADLKEIMMEELNEIKSNLTIDKKTTTASIRAHTSARDNRKSAVSMGYIGILLLLIPVVLIIGSDLPRLFSK